MNYCNLFSLWVLLYILWNFVGFIMVLIDKRRAERNKWRIRERTFFIWALFFGAPGILLGIHMYRHKTRHWSFIIGMPILCIFNIVCAYFLWRQGWLFL